MQVQHVKAQKQSLFTFLFEQFLPSLFYENNNNKHDYTKLINDHLIFFFLITRFHSSFYCQFIQKKPPINIVMSEVNVSCAVHKFLYIQSVTLGYLGDEK